MSEKFFEKLTEMMFGAIIIVLLFTSAIMVMMAFMFTQNMVFYYSFIGVLLFSFLYALNYSRVFKDFKENTYLFIPSENNKPIEPLEMTTDDLPLKCALAYRNGLGYYLMAKKFRFNHPNIAKRNVIKGIDILLKFYQENNCKKVEPC